MCEWDEIRGEVKKKTLRSERVLLVYGLIKGFDGQTQQCAHLEHFFGLASQPSESSHESLESHGESTNMFSFQCVLSLNR